MISPSKFVKIIRQKVIPLQKKTVVVEDQIQNDKEEEEEEKEATKEEPIVLPKIPNNNLLGGTRYIGIDNTDLQQRVQHTIRNLMELDKEELAYIEDLNCRNMFEIVVLLNKVVATLVENMMAIDG